MKKIEEHPLWEIAFNGFMSGAGATIGATIRSRGWVEAIKVGVFVGTSVAIVLVAIRYIERKKK